MIAASLIFYVIGAFALILGIGGAVVFFRRRELDSLDVALISFVSLLLSAGFFAAAGMIWRAA